MAGAAEAHLKAYERDLPEIDVVYTLMASGMRERGWNRLQRDVSTYGSALPWHKAQAKFRLRPSEMTIWAGPNGSLKSATVNFILADRAFHGDRVFLASLELTADDQIARLAMQLTGTDRPTRPQFDDIMDRLGDNLTVYDFVGGMRPERAVALARYAASELQAQHILIDNLTMVVPPGRNSDEQAARLVAALYQVGRDTGAHIHLIAHVRKPDEGVKVLTRYDIRGTGAAPDMVDNCVLMWRNEGKVRARDNDDDSKRDEPDIYFNVDKQRHAPWRGVLGFWLYESCMRLGEKPFEAPGSYC
jgi:twinkle protein